jgi:hypothetical protein
MWEGNNAAQARQEISSPSGQQQQQQQQWLY